MTRRPWWKGEPVIAVRIFHSGHLYDLTPGLCGPFLLTRLVHFHLATWHIFPPPLTASWRAGTKYSNLCIGNLKWLSEAIANPGGGAAYARGMTFGEADLA